MEVLTPTMVYPIPHLPAIPTIALLINPQPLYLQKANDSSWVAYSRAY